MFGNTNFNNRKGLKSQQRRNRSMQMEALEARELLSVSPYYQEMSDYAPAMVSPMTIPENQVPKHEIVVDLSSLYQQYAQPQQAASSSPNNGADSVCYHTLLYNQSSAVTQTTAQSVLLSGGLSATGNDLYSSTVTEYSFYPSIEENASDNLLVTSTEYALSASGRAQDAPNKNATSDIMIGNVYVKVVLLESSGKKDKSTENWNATRKAEVKSEISEGLAWWETAFYKRYPNSPVDLIFHTNFDYLDNPFETKYEPINRPHTSDKLWVVEYLNAQGYPCTESNVLATFNQYNHDLRLQNNCDWAYTVFVADSKVDPDGEFTDGYFAYAYIGGPYAQMTYDNSTWTIARMDITLAHETGHIFGALDEYNSGATYGSGQSSSYTQKGGYYGIKNSNAWNNPTGHQTDSIMASGALQEAVWKSYTSSTPSLEMIGWRDSDNDGIIDYLDQPLTLTDTNGSWDFTTKTFHFEGSSAVTCMENQRVKNNNHTLNTVDELQYKIDNGTWQPVRSWLNTSRVSINESIDLSGSSISGGQHTITFRTYCKRTTITSKEVSYTFAYAGLATPSLRAERKSSTSVSVSIGTVSRADKYQLEYSTDPNFTNPKVSTYTAGGSKTVSGLTANATYYFRVKATSSSTSYSDSNYSPTVSVSLGLTKLSSPDLSFNSISSTVISVNIGSVTNASGYKLEYSTNPNFTSSITKTYTTPGTKTIDKLVTNKTYYFRVIATGSGDYSNSDYSNVISATTSSSTSTIVKLSAPSLSIGSSTSSSITVNIGSVTNASRYRLEYSTDSNFTNPTVSTYTSGGSKTISGLTANKTYYFRVMATGAGNYSNSDYSESQTGKTTSSSSTVKLAAPTLRIDSIGSTSISVYIGSVDNASNYKLEYSTSPSFTSSTTKTYSTSGTQTITNLTANKTYYFRVMATTSNAGYINSDYSGTEWATTTSSTSSTTKLATPSLGLTQSGTNAVSVTVGAVQNAVRYQLEYSTSSSFTSPTTLDVASGTRTISLSSNATYYFRVKAIGSNNYTDSDYSATRSISLNTMTNQLPWPDLSIIGRSSNSVTVEIGDVGATQYILHYSTDSNFSTYSSRSFSNLTKTIYDLAPDTTYYFRVSATRPGYNNSDFSPTVSATTLTATSQLSAPSLSASTIGSSSISVTIGSVDNATSYTLYYSSNKNFSGAQSTTYSSAGGHTVSGLSANTTYYFRVIATPSEAGYTSSNYSETVSATTNADMIQLPAPDLSFSSRGSDWISVYIGGVTRASSYVLQYASNSNFTNAKTFIFPNAGSYTINDLSPNTTYHFRVMATGTGNYASSSYTTRQFATLAESVSSDEACLREFLETTDDSGVKNGKKINNNYNANETSTWTGVTWESINGVMRITEIDWKGKDLYGNLNLSACSKLTSLDVGYAYHEEGDLYNYLTGLNVSGCTALQYLNCSCNALTELNVENNTALRSLSCYCNALEELNVSNNASLLYLLCYSNQISSLDLSNNTALGSLDCSYNQLTSLNLEKNVSLWNLNCESNQLRSLDLSKNTALGQVVCFENMLTSLNVSSCTALNYLECQYNNLSQLDLSKNAQLKSLYCDHNQLTSLNLTNNKDLIWLTCSYNQLNNLNLSNNKMLNSLKCYGNQLTSLDVSNNTALKTLYCNGNPLTSLDVSKNTALTTLYCWNANLKSIQINPATADLSINLDYSRWTFRDANNNTLANNAYNYEYKASNSVSLPITAVNDNDNQTIVIARTSITTLAAPTLSVGVNAANSSVYVTVGAVANASGYTLQYSTNEDFSNPTTTSAVSSGSNVINDLRANTMYYFRVMALGSNSYGNSEYSAVTSFILRNGDVVSDIDCLRSFLELTDSDGVKNGYKINSSYNANDTSTWSGVSWSQINGEMHATAIDWEEYSLVGDLDASGCPYLNRLYCYSNQLTSINVSGCTELTMLYCDFNELTSLDVSHNANLSWLSCTGNQLTSLNVSQNTALSTLYCDSNQLTSLNVANNLALGFLECSGNQLTELNVNNNTQLWQLNCSSNLLTSLNVTNNTQLSQLRCSYNQLTSLNVSNNTELWHLDCNSNSLSQLNLTNNLQLMELYCGSNSLTSLDVTSNTKLKWFGCNNNSLTSLNLTENTDLVTLNCSSNQLSTLNVTKNTLLERLYCDSNKLTSLDLTKNTVLSSLYCNSNSLTSLDLTKNTELIYLYCYSNQLTSLDLTKNTALNWLYCDSNKFTSLDVSKNTNMTWFSCTGNNLTSLDVSKNTALTTLYCDYNKLTSLDLSKNTELSWLYCDHNLMTTLDVSNNLSLTSLYCWNPSLSSVIINPETSYLNISLGSSGWTLRDVNGNTLSSNAYSYDYRASNSSLLPITATNADNGQTQTISIVNYMINTLATPTLSVRGNGSDSAIVTVGNVPNATGYQLQYSTNPNFTNPSSQNVSVGNSTVYGLNANTTYYFRVRALGSDNYTNSEYSATKTISTESGKLASPTLSVSITGTNSATVYIGSVSHANGYVLQYSTNANFSNPTSMNYTSAGSKTFNNLSVNTTYYFRVRATGSGDYASSDYCTTVSATTSRIKLNTPTLSVSPSGSDSVSINVGSVANASGYTVQYSNNANFSNPQYKTVSAGSSSINGLNSNTTYYFRVKANETGNYSDSDYSSTYTAKTNAPGIKLSSPSLSVTVTGSNSVSINVGSVEHASGYRIEYSTDSSFANSSTKDASAGSNSINNLTANTKYYFRVKAVGTGNYSDSDYSDSKSATTNKIKLSTPSLDVSISSSNSVTVRVAAVPNASGYMLQYSTSSNFSNSTDVSLNANESSKLISNLSSSMTYYFRVKATGSASYSDSDYSQSKSLIVSYDATSHDDSCVRAFLEQKDSKGVKNGAKLNSSYNANDPSTWTGVTRSPVNGEVRVTNISWMSKDLVGTLDLSNCTSLKSLMCTANSLTSLNVTGCTALTTLWCYSNKLTQLNLSDCTAITTLDCSSNQLTELDVSSNTALKSLTCYSNKLTLMDLSHNTALSLAQCWCSTLKTVIFNPARSLNIDLGDAGNSNSSWKIQDATGKLISNNTREYNYKSSTTDVMPLTAVNSRTAQKVILTNIVPEPLAAPVLSINGTGYNSISVNVASVAHASGYSLQYATDSNFSNLQTVSVSAGSTTINGLKTNTTYYFRVKATGSGNYTNSDYSNSQFATTDELVGALVSIDGKKISLVWAGDNPAADAVRYRAVGTTRWTTQNLQAGVTEFSFNGAVGTNYEIEVLLDKRTTNVLQAAAAILDQPKLSVNKNSLKDDTFQVNVTNYTAKNLSTNSRQAFVTVNGVQTSLDIVNQQGSSALSGGGTVAFSNGVFTFSEMSSNTQYKIQVSFSDGISVSTVSSALSVKTTKTCYPEPVITSAQAVSDTSIAVTWETAYGKKSTTAAQKYTIQYSTDGVKWSNATTGATGNSFTIQRLKGGIEYKVRVLATKDNSFEASAPSDVLNAETLTLPKIALEKNSVTDDSFKVNVTNYQNSNLVKATAINVKSDRFGTATIYLQNGSGTASFSNGMLVAFNNGSLSFAKAPSATQQKIQLSFVKDVCETAWSQALTIKTTIAKYNKPTLTSAVAISSTSVTVRWEPAYGKNSSIMAQKYTVQYSVDGVHWTNATTSATGTSFIITKMKPNTKYLVAIIANKDSSFNASMPSDSLLVTTMTN